MKSSSPCVAGDASDPAAVTCDDNNDDDDDDDDNDDDALPEEETRPTSLNEVTEPALEGQQAANGTAVGAPSNEQGQSMAVPAKNYHNDDTAIPEVETCPASSSEVAEPGLEKQEPPDSISASAGVVAPTAGLDGEDQSEGQSVYLAASLYREQASYWP